MTKYDREDPGLLTNWSYNQARMEKYFTLKTSTILSPQFQVLLSVVKGKGDVTQW